MNIPCRIALATILPLLLVTAALAQQPPKASVPGPSLDVTLKFIKDQLLKEGTVNYALSLHDSQNPSAPDRVMSYSFQVTSFDYDSAHGTITFAPRYGAQGILGTQNVSLFPLANIEQVQVMGADLWWAHELALEGQPTMSVKMQQPTFILSFTPRLGTFSVNCHGPDGTAADCAEYGQGVRVMSTWTFSDEDTAKRVASALVHAVALCGGGSKDPF